MLSFKFVERGFRVKIGWIERDRLIKESNK